METHFFDSYETSSSWLRTMNTRAPTSMVTLTYCFHLVDSGVISIRKKNPKMEIVFLCFDVLYFLCEVTRLECFHVDVGATRPGGSSPLDRRARACFVPQGDDVIRDLEENLKRLTLDILDASIDDLPMRYQRFTAGVPGCFSRLLRRVARAVMCYHEHH